MKKETFGSIVAGSVASLLIGGYALAQAGATKPAAKPAAPAAKVAEHNCQNACKGKSACDSPGKHKCHGQNACKGQGYLKADTAEKCAAEGGTWKAKAPAKHP